MHISNTGSERVNIGQMSEPSNSVEKLMFPKYMAMMMNI